MTWFKVDDTLAAHPKGRRAGLAALGLWTVCGSWSSQQLTNGWVPDWQVDTWQQGRRYAEKLVNSGLWHRGFEEAILCGCATPDQAPSDPIAGWQFHDWTERQPTREQVLADREAARQRQKRAREAARQQRTSRRDSSVSHGVSHGVTYGVTSPEVTDDVTGDVTVPPTRPDPTRSRGYVSEVSPVSDEHERPTDQNDTAARVATLLGCTQRHALAVTRDVLSRATRTPADPGAYVLAAVRAEPGRFRPTDGPPRIDQLCSEHARPAATCPFCRAQAASA